MRATLSRDHEGDQEMMKMLHIVAFCCNMKVAVKSQFRGSKIVKLNA